MLTMSGIEGRPAPASGANFHRHVCLGRGGYADKPLCSTETCVCNLGQLVPKGEVLVLWQVSAFKHADIQGSM